MSKVLSIAAVITWAAVLHALFLQMSFPAHEGVALAVVLWAGRIWEQMDPMGKRTAACR